jgi:hypothetical protein
MLHEVPLNVAGAGCMRAKHLFKRAGLFFGSRDDIERGVSAHHAQEFGRQLVPRLREHLMRRTVLDHLATCQKHDAVSDLIGEAKLMGRNDHRQAVFDGEPLNDFQDFSHEFGVERRGRFIEEEHPRVRRKGACDCHALLLAAGQMPRQGIGAMAQADALEQLMRPLVGVSGRHAVHPSKRTGDIFSRVQMREQVELLEHHADARARAFIGEFTRAQASPIVAKTEAFSGNPDLAAVPLFKVIDTPEQGAFARAARP